MKISPEDLRQRLLPIFFAQAVGLACGLIGVRLTSHLVDPADYGVYGVFVSLASIGVGVVYAGLVKFVSRYWQGASDRAGLLHEMALGTLRKAPWLLAVCLGATLLAARGHLVVFGTMLFASAFLLALTQLAQSALQAAREHWRDLGVSAGLSITRSFLPPLLYGLTGAGVAALLGGFVLHGLTGLILGSLALRRWWRAPEKSGSPILTAIYDGPQFVILAAVGWTLLGMNRWLVAWRFGSETAGYFTLASNIGILLPTILGTMMLQYFQPQWFAVVVDHPETPRKLLQQVDRVALIYMLAALGVVIGLHFSMPFLIGPLVSARYLPAAAFVLGIGCWGVSLSLGIFYHAILLAARREQACSVVDLSGAVCLILGSTISVGIGMACFKGWLAVSPLVPWLVNRTLARRALLSSS